MCGALGGAVIDDTKRTYLSELLFGNEDKNIQGIISLFSGNYHFKAYGGYYKGLSQASPFDRKRSQIESFKRSGIGRIIR